MRVIWSARAMENLRMIFEYISADSPQNAQQVLIALSERPRVLAQFPLIGSQTPELSDKNIRELLQYSYRIIYKVKPDEVEILTVIHCKQSFRQSFYKK